MSFDTVVSLIFLGLAFAGFLVRCLSTHINWAMVYYKLCGGK